MESEIEQPRDDAGRFAGGEGEQLFGREAENADAGYTTRKDDPAPAEIGADEESMRAAADTLVADEEPSSPVMAYLDATGRLDPNEAVTVKQAADDYGSAEGDISTYVEGAGLAEIAEQVDSQRREAFKGDTNAGDIYGHTAEEVKALEAKQSKNADFSDIKTMEDVVKLQSEDPSRFQAWQTQQAALQASKEAAPVDGIDPELDRALKHPKIAEAVSAEWARAADVAAKYGDGLNIANQFAQQSVLDHLPELGNVPPDQWQAAIMALAQQDPNRVQRALGPLQRVSQLQQAQAQWQHHQVAAQQHQFEGQVKAEDTRLVQMLGEKAADEATRATLSYLSQNGIARNQMASVFMQNPVLKTAEARQVLWKAAKYDELLSAPKAVASKPLPPVQRPGVSAPKSSDSNSGKIAALERQFERATGQRQVDLGYQILQLRGAV